MSIPDESGKTVPPSVGEFAVGERDQLLAHNIYAIAALGDKRKIAEAILWLGSAYRDLLVSDDCENPAMPWARIGDKIFVYSQIGGWADQIQGFVSGFDRKTFDLAEVAE